MRTTLVTAGIVVALVLSLIALWLGGPFRLDRGRPGVVFAGKWCCASCKAGSLKCTGCKSAASSGYCGGPVGGPGTIFVDCTGNTTEDTTTGTVTCY